MSSKPKIYLAGGMEKAGPYGSIWRKEITPHLELLGYDVWNPYEQEVNAGIFPEDLPGVKKRDYDLFVKYCRNIVDYDIEELSFCSAVAVRIDQSVLDGAGTYGEMTVCRLLDIPVYGWIDLPNGERDVPGWAMGCLSDYKTNKDDFYSSIPAACPGELSPRARNMMLAVNLWA